MFGIYASGVVAFMAHKQLAGKIESTEHVEKHTMRERGSPSKSQVSVTLFVLTSQPIPAPCKGVLGEAF